MKKLLDFISGFMEIGSVLYGLSNFGIAGAFCGALCYQAGNIVPSPFNPSAKASRIFAIAGLALATAAIFNPLFYFAAMPLISMSLQSARAIYKKLPSSGENVPEDKYFAKMLKRICRVLGFALGFCLNPCLLAICAAAVIFALFKENGNEKSAFKKPCMNVLSSVLVLHEIHYFVYCYSAMLIVYLSFQSIMWASLAFAASWLSYVFCPNIYQKINFFSKIGHKRTFVIAHFILCLVLAGMCFCLSRENPTFLILAGALWLLTGVFGTTEFCIEELARKNGTYDKNSHNSAENIGHILGVALSGIIYAISGSLAVSVAAGAMFALFALLVMAFFAKETSK